MIISLRSRWVQLNWYLPSDSQFFFQHKIACNNTCTWSPLSLNFWTFESIYTCLFIFFLSFFSASLNKMFFNDDTRWHTYTSYEGKNLNFDTNLDIFYINSSCFACVAYLSHLFFIPGSSVTEMEQEKVSHFITKVLFALSSMINSYLMVLSWKVVSTMLFPTHSHPCCQHNGHFHYRLLQIMTCNVNDCTWKSSTSVHFFQLSGSFIVMFENSFH